MAKVSVVKVISTASKIVVWAKSPQGKRDITLAVTGVVAAFNFVKGVI